MKDLLINAESIWCTQHMENNDAEKLRSLGVNGKDRSRIMADIYGSQNEIYCRMDRQMRKMWMSLKQG